MQKDERDLIDVLKFELKFLEDGGYDRLSREPWRPQYIFEDSPTCVNYGSKPEPSHCSECVLMHLVPPESRKMPMPCRHIRLNAAGETLQFGILLLSRSSLSLANQVHILPTGSLWSNTIY
jgi:hypothetical protein